MRRLHSIARLVFLLLGINLLGTAQTPPVSGTAPFILDGNRIYVELDFVRTDGGLHRGLAFVDMGSPAMTVTAALFKELQLEHRRPLTFRLGELTVHVPAEQVESDPAAPYSVGTALQVEAVLPAAVMRHYQVVIDYQNRRLTFASPERIKPQGVPVDFRAHPETGLIEVQAEIAGRSYAVTIDNGSAYTWFRQETAKSWLRANPKWECGVGAIGASNMMMADDGTEAAGTLLRIPEMRLAGLTLMNVGVLAPGRGRPLPGNLDLFDWYSKKNVAPVIGWIGGNVLKSFRLTIDYPNHILYWLKFAEADRDDLNQVGLTLASRAGEYLVAGIAQKDHRATVQGVTVGDQLLEIEGLKTKAATWGEIYDGLHGKPGESRRLMLQRGASTITVRAPVTAF